MSLSRIHSLPPLLVVLTVLLSSPALAQEDEPARDDAPPVYVPDDKPRTELEAAEAAAKAGLWSSAIGHWLAAREKFPQSVWRAGQGFTYIGVREYVDRRLAALPPEGVEAFRSACEPVATTRFAQARDRRDLDAFARVAEDDFRTSVGPDAAWITARAAAAAGDFATAAGWASRILRDAPASDVAGPFLISHLALWSAAAGEPDRCAAAHALAEREPSAGARPLSEFTARCLVSARERRPDRPSCGEWPTAGGNPSRSGRAQEHPVAQMKAWGWPPGPARPAEPAPTPPSVPSIAMEVLPVVTRGRVILPIPMPERLVPPESRSAIALDLKGGEEVWEMPDTNPTGFWGRGPGARGSFLFGGAADETGTVFLNLLAPVGEEVAGYAMGGRAVALDVATGAVRWDTQNRPEALFHEPGVFSPPLVTPVGLFLAALVIHAEPEVHVIALDPATGAPRWSSFLCAGTRRTGGLFACTPTLSESNGRLYCCTNVGTVAALEARTGAILWITSYLEPDADPSAIPPSTGSVRPTLLPPSPNFPLLTGRICYVLPTDGLGVYAANVDSGELQLLPGTANARYLVGLTDRWLVATSRDHPGSGDRGEHLCLVDRKTRTLAIDPPPRLGTSLPGESRLGRPILTEEVWYFPTTQALERQEKYADDSPEGRPRGGRLCDLNPGPCGDPGDPPSNCTVVDRWILVTSGQRIVALFEQSTFDEMFARDRGLGFYLDHARVMEQNGRTSDALADYRKILDLIAAMPSPSDEDKETGARARSALSHLHRSLGDEAVKTGRWEDAMIQYRSGLRVCASVEDAAPLRFALAVACERATPPQDTAAANEYTQLLLDGARGPVEAGGGLRTSVTALALARLSALRDKDPAAFDEARAGAATSAFKFKNPGQGQGLDTAWCDEFLARYPFSREASEALTLLSVGRGWDFLRTRSLLLRTPESLGHACGLQVSLHRLGEGPAPAWSWIGEAEARVMASRDGSEESRQTALCKIDLLRALPEFETIRESIREMSGVACHPFCETAVIAPLPEDVALATGEDELKNAAAPWICTPETPSVIAPEGFGVCRGGEFQWRAGADAAVKWTLPDARPWIGIRQSHSFAPPGVLIEKVYAGQPADAAGVKVKDVLVAANDTSVDSLPGLISFLSTCKSDGPTPVRLIVARAGKRIRCPATLVPRPALFGTPVADLFVLDDGGLLAARPFQLTALAPDGEVRWRFPPTLTSLPEMKCVGTAAGRIFVLIRPGSDGADFVEAGRPVTEELLVALNSSTGAVEWQRAVSRGAPRTFTPVPGLGGILVGTPRRLEWLEGTSGLTLWKTDTMVGTQDGRPFPILLDGTLCVHAEASGVWHGYDLALRRDRWHLPVESPAYAPVHLRSDGEMVVWVGHEGTLTAVHPVSGQVFASGASFLSSPCLPDPGAFRMVGPGLVAGVCAPKAEKEGETACRIELHEIGRKEGLRQIWEKIMPPQRRIQICGGYGGGVLVADIAETEGVAAPARGATPAPANIFLLEPLKGGEIWRVSLPMSADGVWPPVAAHPGRLLVAAADGVHVYEPEP
ncbi:MAG: PQQ-binding-like beta-propeller repeat protein [Planctomycetes bacterium]|nr:PQQ-binding-like beta-propeller repeat protein [Planctomycetota bacterium]